ncbi:MAG: FISUMP domain-containing protein [Clostridia bacterium]
MQRKDIHKPVGGLNTDDDPSILPPEDYTDALNMRITSSSEQHGVGVAETLQSEIEVLLDTAMGCLYYYGSAIGGQFVYEGYEEVQIGTQVWMKRNWDVNFPGSKVYDNDEDNREVYGGLYNWYQINQGNFIPDGWHVPTEAEINTLLTYIGGILIGGGKLKEFGLDHWLTPNTDGGDNFGFKALPGGKYDSAFSLLTEAGLFWLADEYIPTPPAVPIVISITHTKIGELMITLDGSDDVYIDWGDGNIELVNTSDQEFYHTYVGGGTIQIYDAVGITNVTIQDDSITDVDIPAECINIEYIQIASENLATLPTHAEWVNLWELGVVSLSGNPILTGLTIDTHAEWVNLYGLALVNFDLSTLVTHPEWVGINAIQLHDDSLVSFALRPEWVNLAILALGSASLNSVTLATECIQMRSIGITESILNPIILPSEYILIDNLRLTYNTQVTSISIPNTYTLLEDVYITDNPVLEEIIIPNTCVNLGHIILTDNALTETSVNNILITLDSMAITFLDLRLNGGTNAAPTGLGLTAKNNMIGRGLTVVTN